MQIIRVEETPNPAALKFIMAEPLVANGRTLSFVSNEDEDYTGDNALALALFKVGACDVFLCQDYVSVTMFSANAWEYLMADVKSAIETHTLPLGEEPVKAEPKDSVLDHIDRDAFPNLSDKEKLSIIDSLMDEIIRPALANDGGGLEIIKVEGDEVLIKYQGACGSCPSSIGGTLAAIERLVQNHLDPNMKITAGAAS